MTDLELGRLRVELTTDPAGLGYAEWVADGSDQALADLLNHVRDGTTPARDGKPLGAAIKVERVDISPDEVLATLQPGDEAAPLLPLLMARPVLSATLVWKLGLSYLDGLCRRPGSRAEQLFGTGTMIAHLDVARALGRGV